MWQLVILVAVTTIDSVAVQVENTVVLLNYSFLSLARSLGAIAWSFFGDCDTIRINLTPAPTVVLPDAVVPSRNSADTFVVLIKSIYFCDSGNLLLTQSLTTQLSEHIG